MCAGARVFTMCKWWRPEVDMEFLPQLLPTLIFETGSVVHLELGDWPEWPASAVWGCSSTSMGLEWGAAMPAFFVSPEDLNSFSSSVAGSLST